MEAESIEAVVIDLGTSLTKIIYYYLGQFFFFAQSSSVLELDHRKYQQHSSHPKTKTHAIWTEGAGYLVGRGASQPYEEVDLSQTKATSAIAKVLAAIGEIKDRINTDKEIKLENVILLLPLKERKEYETLKTSIVKALYGFGFNGKTTKFWVGRFNIQYEGYGITTISTEERAAFAVFGQKDLTIGAMNQGDLTPNMSQTLVGWGMSKVLEEVQYTFESDVYGAKCVYSYNQRRTNLKKLIPAEKVEFVSASIDRALSSSWYQIERKLDSSQALMDAVTIYVTGGSSQLWRKQLKGVYGRRLNYLDGIAREIAETFPQLDKDPMILRMADAYLTIKGMVAA